MMFRREKTDTEVLIMGQILKKKKIKTSMYSLISINPKNQREILVQDYKNLITNTINIMFRYGYGYPSYYSPDNEEDNTKSYGDWDEEYEDYVEIDEDYDVSSWQHAHPFIIISHL